jgi:hypothetical protein
LQFPVCEQSGRTDPSDQLFSSCSFNRIRLVVYAILAASAYCARRYRNSQPNPDTSRCE